MLGKTIKSGVGKRHQDDRMLEEMHMRRYLGTYLCRAKQGVSEGEWAKKKRKSSTGTKRDKTIAGFWARLCSFSVNPPYLGT